MEKEASGCIEDESLEEVTKTLKDLIAQAEDRIRRTTEGKIAVAELPNRRCQAVSA